jgi:phosphatidylinositol-3-phosphatase
MKTKISVLCLTAALMAAAAVAQEGPVPKGVPPLNHVFLIMMENHGYPQLIGNPFAPFINSYALSANLATNYFAVAHPSLTNYLEVTAGSNFNILDDNSPDWHNATCQPNIATNTANVEADSSPICPISGSGTDAATPLLDCYNEVTGPPCDIEIDNVHTFAANTNTLGISIADQLVAANKTWKTYQESLPILVGPDFVDYSDGNFTNNTSFTAINTALTAGGGTPVNSGDIVQLYAVKHNPFAYFQDIQQGTNPELSYAQMAAFDGAGGLYSDLATGKVASFSYIVPNQCNDQHGRTSYLNQGNASPFCGSDPNDNGTQVGLDPALITLGDQAVQKIVNAIHASPVWTKGHNAIVVIWDEDDYSVQPTINQVAAIVDTSYGFHGITSSQFYTHFSLLRTLEAGFKLPCLNNACASGVNAIEDLFGEP